MAFGTDDAATLRLRLDTGDIDAGLSRTESSFGSWAGAIKGALAAAGIVEGTRTFLGWVEAGGKVSDLERSLTTDIREATKAIDGQVGRMALITSANQLAQRGLQLSANEFRSLAVAAQDFSDRTGVDAEQALDQLTSAVIRGTTRGLKPFGIEANNSADAVQKLVERFGDAENTASNAAEAFDQLKASAGDMFDQFTRGVAESEGLKAAIDSLNDALGSSEGGARGLGSAVGDLAGMAVLMNPLISAVSNLARAFRELPAEARLSQIQEILGERRRARHEAAGRALGVGTTIEEGTATTISTSVVTDPAAVRAAAEGLGIEFGPQGGGGGGGGGKRADAAKAALEAAVRAQYDQERADFQRAQEARERDDAQAAENAQRKLDILEDARREAHEAELEQVRQFNQELAEEEERAAELAKEAAEEQMLMHEALGVSLTDAKQLAVGFTGALIQSAKAAIQEGRSVGQVFQAITAAGLDQISEWAAQKAALNAAMAIESLARYDFGAAGLHAAAAVAYGAIALGAGALSGAVAPPTGGGGGGASLAPGGGGGDLGRVTGGGNGEGRPINVTVVYQPSTGGYIPDAHLRDLLDQIGEGIERGYA